MTQGAGFGRIARVEASTCSHWNWSPKSTFSIPTFPHNRLVCIEEPQHHVSIDSRYCEQACRPFFSACPFNALCWCRAGLYQSHIELQHRRVESQQQRDISHLQVVSAHKSRATLPSTSTNIKAPKKGQQRSIHRSWASGHVESSERKRDERMIG